MPTDETRLSLLEQTVERDRADFKEEFRKVYSKMDKFDEGILDIKESISKINAWLFVGGIISGFVVNLVQRWFIGK